MSFEAAMSLVDDDLPDGAFFAMAHEIAGLEYGDGFAELAEGQSHETFEEVAQRKPFKCLCCNKRFQSKASLEQHNKAAGHEPVDCPICSKRFGSTDALKHHTLAKHGAAP